jgi:hypothetical protein
MTKPIDKYGASKYLKKQDVKEITVLNPDDNKAKLEEVTAIVLDKFLAKVAYSADFDARDVSAIERLANAITKISDDKRKQEAHDLEFGSELNRDEVLALMTEQFKMLTEEEKHKLICGVAEVKKDVGS